MRGYRGKAALGLAALLSLGACTNEAPDRAAGVGFGDYNAYLTQREAALQGTQPIPQAMTSPSAAAVLPTNGAPAVTGQPLNPMGAALTLPPAAAATPATVPTSSPAVAVVTEADISGRASISDEQSFEAVAERETIESDAERIAANRAAYVQLPAEPLPERATATAPNLAAYALAAPNRKGESIYNRIALKFVDHDRACAKYASPDLAQTDFLEKGGPERDLGNLDPDGDGFACTWDPTPFQSVRAAP